LRGSARWLAVFSLIAMVLLGRLSMLVGAPGWIKA